MTANPSIPSSVAQTDVEKIRAFVDGHTLPGNSGKPLCVIEPWCKDFRGGDNFKWDAWVKAAQPKWRFWQVGLRFDSAVEGCEFYLWGARNSRSLRRTQALISLAQVFVGSDPQLLEFARGRGLRVIELKRSKVHHDTGTNAERSDLLPPEEKL